MKFEFTKEFLESLGTLPNEKFAEGVPIKLLTTEGIEIDAVFTYLPARNVYCLDVETAECP